jgi:cbb3-type cytochrome oxidase subunit 3
MKIIHKIKRIFEDIIAYIVITFICIIYYSYGADKSHEKREKLKRFFKILP